MALPETDRLVLRQLTEADADAVYHLNASPKVVRHVGEPPLESRAAALAVLRERIFPQYALGVGRWAVVHRASGQLLGWCGLRLLPSGEHDLGYRFVEEAWGQGYATEAASAVLRWARGHLPGARIIGTALVENHASVRVLRKLGMRFEGTRQDEHGTSAVFRCEVDQGVD